MNPKKLQERLEKIMRDLEIREEEIIQENDRSFFLKNNYTNIFKVIVI